MPERETDTSAVPPAGWLARRWPSAARNDVARNDTAQSGVARNGGAWWKGAAQWCRVAGWTCAAAVLYALYLRISSGGRIDSDGANSALQAWDLIHGDLLLHGWVFGDATFYAFELPVNGITQLIFGLGPLAAHSASALAYFIVTACAVALAVAGSRGAAQAARGAVTVAVFAAPLLTMLMVMTLVEEPDHPGTSVFILVPALLLDRLAPPSRPRSASWRWVAPLTCVILAAGQLGDATVTFVAVPAIALVCAYRVLAGHPALPQPPPDGNGLSETSRGSRFADLGVLVAVIASVPLEMLIRVLMKHLGGYQEVAPLAGLAPPGLWLGHVPVVWLNIRYLFGAVPRTDTMLGATGAALGLICLIAAIAGLAKVVLTWHRASRAEQVMAAVIVVNLGVYLLSRMPLPDGTREITAVLPCGAVLAARALVPGQLARRSLALAAVAVSALFALFPLAMAATRPAIGPATGPAPGDPGSVQTAPLTDWLVAHGVSYGIGGYWDSSIVTLQSGGRVAIRTVYVGPRPNGTGSRFFVRGWETNVLWYDPGLHDARWAIADAWNSRYSARAYESAFGKPEAMYRVSSWIVLEYRVNLLTEIGPVPALPH